MKFRILFSRSFRTVCGILLTIILFLAGSIVSATAEQPDSPSASDPAALVSVRLGYEGDSSHPEGVTLDPGGKPYSGLIRVNAGTHPTKPVKNLKVVLHAPGQYVDSLSVNPSSDNTYTVSPQSRQDGDTTITITWPSFNPSTTPNITFTVGFAAGVTPEGTVIHPYVETSSDQNPTPVKSGELTIIAKYPPMTMQKEANGEFADDSLVVGSTAGADSACIPEDSTGKNAVIDFTFPVTYEKDKPEDKQIGRYQSAVTVTDTLPTYTDCSGGMRTASFSGLLNPEWKLSSDGKSATFSHMSPSDQGDMETNNIPALHLTFPGLKLTGHGTSTKPNEPYSFGVVTNHATLTAKTANPSPTELKERTASDSIRIRVATRAAAFETDKLSFHKYTDMAGLFSDHDLSDTLGNKTKSLPWDMQITNNSHTPEGHIVLDDRPGETTCQGASSSSLECGLDPRMRFTEITGISIYNGQKQLDAQQTSDAIQSITAYQDDGSTRIYTWPSTGSQSITFGDNVNGITITFKPTWLLQPGGTIDAKLSTKIRDPQTLAWSSTDTGKNALFNTGTMSAQPTIRIIDPSGKPVLASAGATRLISSRARYILTQFKESLSIYVSEYRPTEVAPNDPASPDWHFDIKGNLDPGKDYSTLKVVGLLPPGMEWRGWSHVQSAWGASPEEVAGIVDPERIALEQNYKETGWTAVIIPLNQQVAKKFMNGSNHEAWLEFKAAITTASRPGKGQNTLIGFITADNAPDPGPATLLPSQYGSEDYGKDLPIAGNGVAKDNYHIGPHATIQVGTFSYTVDLESNLYGYTQIQSGSTTSSTGANIRLNTPFTYHLAIRNIGNIERPGLTIFDALPTIGSKNTDGTTSRVHLNAWPSPPYGENKSDSLANSYTIYYSTTATTTDNAADSSWKTQTQMMAAGTSCTDVTAIKLVANTGVKTPVNATITLDLPVIVTHDTPKPAISDYHNNTNGPGVIAHVEATNSFNYKTAAGPDPTDPTSGGAVPTWHTSNTVYARLHSYAGFFITARSLTNAALLTNPTDFTITPQSGLQSQTVNFTPGYTGLTASDTPYTITEKHTPTGYLPVDGLNLTVTNDSSSLIMSCTPAGATPCQGKGTPQSPFILLHALANPPLPMTGSPWALALLGTLLFTLFLSFVTLNLWRRTLPDGTGLSNKTRQQKHVPTRMHHGSGVKR